MTIKKRLSLSNIFMIIIPIIVCFVIGGLSLGGGYLILKSNNGVGFDESNFYESKEIIVHQINEGLDALDPKSELNGLASVIDSKQVRVIIYEGSQVLYEYGEVNQIDSELSTIAENKEIFLIENDRQLYSYDYQNINGNYRILIFCSSQPTSYTLLKQLIIILAIIMVITIVGSVLLTSYFLSRFVFKQIEKPLDLLLQGTKQLSSGELGTRIEYKEENEFKPIIDEFNQMASELQKSIEVIKQNEQNRTMLVAGISHDIKSPLTSIRGYVEGILDGVANTPAKQKKYLGVIQTKCLEIDKLIGQMISLTKDEIQDENVKISLKETLISFVNENSEAYQNQGLAITLDIRTDARINCSSDDFSRVIANICDNALKYKVLEKGTLKIEAVKEKDLTRLSFIDDGPGVNEEDITHLFDAFYRADKSRNHPEKGSGLGLAIVEKIIRNSKGKTEARNVSPHGLAIDIKWKEEENE